MFAPDYLFLQISKSISKKNNWLPQSILRDVLSTSLLDKKTDKIEFDLFGMLDIKPETSKVPKSLVDSQILIFNNFFDTVIQAITNLASGNTNISTLDYQLYLVKIYLDYKNGQTPIFTTLVADIKQKTGKTDDEAREYIINQLDNFHYCGLAYGEFSTLLNSLKETKDKLSTIFETQEDVDLYYEIWLLYKAFLSLPGEIYSFVDDINFSGFLVTPNQNQISQKIKEVKYSLNLLPEKEDLDYSFNQIKEYVKDPVLISNLMRGITKIYPADVEALYNFSKMFRASDDYYAEKTIELTHIGKDYKFDISIFKESVSLDDLALLIENFDLENPGEQLSEIMTSILEFMEELPSLNVSIDNYDSLDSIVGDIFKAVKQIFTEQKINIFTRKAGLSIFDIIAMVEDFPIIYETLSGNLDVIKYDQNEFNTQSLSLLISTYFNTKLKSLEKLTQQSYLDDLKEKRLKLYLDAIEMKLSVLTNKADHSGTLKQIIDYSKSLDLNSTKELNYESLDFDDLDDISNKIISITNDVLALVVDNLAGETNDEVFEKLQILMSTLGKVGASVDFNSTTRAVTVNLDRNILENYFKGYYSYNALENKYNIRNLLSFGMMKGINVE